MPAPQATTRATAARLSLGFCRTCGTVQLVDRFALEALRKRNPPVRFREPEAHLPALAEKMLALGVVDARSRVLGLTYIDADLSKALRAGGCQSVDWIDFEAWAPCREDHGLESVAQRVSQSEVARRMRARENAVDVVCARFVLEHAESAYEFMTDLLGLVRPGGHVVVEVPDASKMLALGNHALVWEDHFTYFTEGSLRQLAARLPATVVDMARYPYAYEDALVLILRADGIKAPSISGPRPDAIAAVADGLRAFGLGFAARKDDLHKTLSDSVAAGEKLALFGAGHHAAKYVNFYGLAGLIEFAVDDNPTKQGLFMPGTNLCIRSSKYLLESTVDICICTLAPAAERKVRQSIPAFFERGGRFIPAFNPAQEVGNA